MRAGRVAAALERPTAVHDVVLGDPFDVLLDRDVRRALGLEVRCRDGVDRFVPWSVAELGPERVTVDRPLAMLEHDELEYYRERSLGLAVLRRLPVVSRGRDVARVADVVVDEDGVVLSLVLRDVEGEREVERERLDIGLERVRLLDAREAGSSSQLPPATSA